MQMRGCVRLASVILSKTEAFVGGNLHASGSNLQGDCREHELAIRDYGGRIFIRYTVRVDSRGQGEDYLMLPTGEV